MPMVFRRPAAALAPFVAHLWHFEDPDGDLVHAHERILPTGTMQLLVNLHEDELRSYHDGSQGPTRTRGAAAADRLRTLEAVLLARVVRPLAPDPAIALAISALERDVPVATVAARLGYSARRLISSFGAQVGLTPKRFARVRRFQRVLAAITGGPPTPWAELALACGYFDQSHLIHDFNTFSGLHPTSYAPRDAAGQNHVVLPD